jgi:hypothetical protein
MRHFFFKLVLVVAFLSSLLRAQLYVASIFDIFLLLSRQLYEALHVGEYQIQKERDLHEKLEILNSKLGPLEQVNK